MPADPLANVAEALSAVRSAETRLRQAVDAARDSGCTWAEIGEILGTTRQAASQRFGRPVDPGTGEPMNESVPPGVAERAEFKVGRVSFHRDGTVAGLFVLSPDAT